MLLEAINISKRYGHETIFKDISLGVAEGESMAVTGPSGIGKSTLLSILGLLLNPSDGEIWFQQKRVSDLSDDEQSRLRNRFFGFIFQNPQLIGSLSVKDNVLVPAYLARKTNLEAKAKQILKEMGLENRLNYFPYQLSIGQKRRVAVARALIMEPSVIFADEPTNDLDPERAAWMSEFLFQLPKQGYALVLVTHDRKLAGKADHGIVLGTDGAGNPSMA